MRYLILLAGLFSIAFSNGQTYIDEDFNSGLLPIGWSLDTVSGAQAWQIGLDGAGLHPGNQNLDSTAFAYFDDDILGQNSTNNTASLLSPVFDNSARPQTSLEFDYNFREFSSATDTFKVDVFDGNTWVNVFSQTQNDCGSYLNCSSFPRASIDISAYADSNCQVRFYYHDGDDWAFYVGIDNVKISSKADAELELISIESPLTRCGLDSNEQVIVKIRNNGAVAQSNFSISFQLDNQVTVNELITSTVNPGDSLFYTSSNTFNLFSKRSYSLTTYIDLMGDTVNSNDTLRYQFINQPIYNSSYFNGFENGIMEWEKHPANSTWEVGIPNASTINSTPYGTGILTTHLSGNYLNNDTSYIESSCFDFSADTLDPIVEFSIISHSEQNFDYLYFEYTLDSGQTWQAPNTNAVAYNFGTNGSNSRWDGFRDWEKAGIVLQNLAGEPDVKFRFRLDSDPSVIFNGFGIDNFSITNSSTNNASLAKISSQIIEQACNFSDSIPLLIEVMNWGYDTLRNLRINVQLDSGVIYTKAFQPSHPPISQKDYVFHIPVKSPYNQDYHFNAWIDAVGDSIKFNDSLFNQIITVPENEALFQAPLIEDFENITVPAIPLGWDILTTANTTNPARWITNSGRTPSTNTGADYDNTTGNGNYIYYESSNGGSTSRLFSPCIQLDPNEEYYLSFWYYRYGNQVQRLDLDLFDGQQWNDGLVRIQGQQQTASNQPYRQSIVDLASYKGQTIKLKFETFKNFLGFNGDVCLDDIEIKPKKFIQSAAAEPNCNPNQKLAVQVELMNLFADSLNGDSIILQYTINGQATGSDSLSTTYYFGDKINHIFRDSIRVSNISSPISLKLYAKYNYGGTSIIDSTSFEIQNFLQDNYLKEDFENIPLATNFKVPNWHLDSTWQLINEGVNGFAYTPKNDASNNGQQFIHNRYIVTNIANDARRTVRAVSPCLDFTSSDSIQLKFDYHIRGDQFSTLYIGEWDNGQLVSILDSINGNLIPSDWSNRLIDLSSYVGQNIQIAFEFISRSQSISNSISLDNIQVLDQSNLLDANLIENHVSIQNCDFNNGQISIDIRNQGGLDIPINSIQANYQINNLPPINQFVSAVIPSGQTITHTFSTTANLSAQSSNYSIQTWINHPNDSLYSNDTLDSYPYINSLQLDTLREDFEGFENNNCFTSSDDIYADGWTNDFGIWAIHNSFNCGPLGNQNSGPRSQPKLNSRQFMYIDPPTTNGFQAALNSPCIDISNNSNPYLSFDYHMFGSDINTLFVEINANGSWQLLDSLIGQKQSAKSDPWKRDTVSLSGYTTTPLFKIRFRSLVTGPNSIIAIDNIHLGDSSILTSIDKVDYSLEIDEILIYPNPAKNELNIKGQEELVGKNFFIYNLKGQIQFEGRLNTRLQKVNVVNLAKGVYFIIIPELNIREKVIIY